MYNLEDFNINVFPQTQYLQSAATTSEDVSTYFFPSMVFPVHVELVSATILTKNLQIDKIIRFSTIPNGSDTPRNRSEYNLVHKAGNLTTTINFTPPLILDPLQPFFFHHEEGELPDSCLVLGYKNFNGNFGKLNKP